MVGVIIFNARNAAMNFAGNVQSLIIIQSMYAADNKISILYEKLEHPVIITRISRAYQKTYVNRGIGFPDLQLKLKTKRRLSGKSNCLYIFRANYINSHKFQCACNFLPNLMRYRQGQFSHSD